MKVGIDLGTTFSAVARVNKNGVAEILVNRDGERVTPSVVMFEGDSQAIVGDQAKDNSVMDPLDVVQFVKRQMGNKKFSFETDSGKVLTAEEISAIILKRLKEDAENDTGEKVDGAVITVPAYFNDAQRTATKDAGKIAGLNVIGMINEPTAAALAYCHNDADSDGNIMVFDLGGGTFDVTVLRLSEHLKKIDIVATTGVRNLGGFDFDNEIINKVLADFKEQYDIDLGDDDEVMQDIRLKAENAKKSLSSREKTMISVRAEGKTMKIDLTREQFEAMIHRHLDTMQLYMSEAMEDAHMQWSDLNKILLVGGSTRIPAVQKMIKDYSGIDPSHELNPDEAVALGAAYYAESLSLAESESDGKTNKVKITDVNSHTVGTIANDSRNQPRMVPILSKNTPLPASKEMEFYTVQDGQTQLNVRIVEGEDEDPDYDQIIGESLITMAPKKKNAPIEIRIQYDVNGLIHVLVKDGETNQDLGEFDIQRKENLSHDEVDAKENEMKDFTIE